MARGRVQGVSGQGCGMGRDVGVVKGTKDGDAKDQK